MRTKVDYGIDLGTTNSAIARMQNGEPVILKSDTLKDTMPSCVHFTRKQDIYVGDMAVNALKNDYVRALRNFQKQESNTFLEFKRTMGTNTTYYSSHMGRSFTSEELSAEVLKKLKTFIKDENISAVVITVPAKFSNPQNEATMRAARMAGFQQVHLLQEPVAAAMAYGLSSKIKDGYIVVFDLGGGTFDAALLKAEEGIFTIKDTEGDNWLGGKNIDEAIIDKLFLPYLRENYAIDFIFNDKLKLEILRNALKPYAEEAKIQLSFKEEHNILTNLGDLPFEDENGVEPEIDITINQKTLEEIAAPIFQKAIDITQELLRRNNLTGTDLEALILVGGPTYSPILRKMLKEQITEKVDTSIDPMTVVAKGAALFASTIPISDELREAIRDKTKLQLELNYEATTIEPEEFINIKLLKEKTEGTIPEEVYVDIIRTKPEGYSTGKKRISEKPTLFTLLLEENCPNEFELIAYDGVGNKIECQPNKFSILHGIGGVDSMQVLPYHIGIVKYFPTEDKDLFFPVKGLEKNKPIKSGITGVIDGLKTRSDIRPGVKEDVIRIPIYQGEYNAEGTNPELNYHIVDVLITGEDLPKFLPQGSPVNIRIKVDSSSLMTFIAEFPTIEFEKEVQVEIKQITPPTPNELIQKFNKAKQVAQTANKQDLLVRIDELMKSVETIGTTADGRLRLLDEYRRILRELDEVEKTSDWEQIEKELRMAYSELERVFNEIKVNVKRGNGSVDVAKLDAILEEFRKKIDLVIQEKNKKQAKDLIEELHTALVQIVNAVTGDAMFAEVIQFLHQNFHALHWKDPIRARQLIDQGLQMVANRNFSGIRPILVELVKLLPESERPQTLM